MIRAVASSLSKAAYFAAPLRRQRARPDTVPGPNALQMASFGIDLLRRGERAFDELFDHYGDVVGLSVPEAVPGVSRVVLFRDPALVKPVFTASSETLSNEGNLPIVDLYGTQSMVLLDGQPHVRLRKLTLPHLRGDTLEQWRRFITDVAVREARSLPTGQPVVLHPRMLRCGLEITLRIVIGVEGDRLAEWMTPMTELLECAVSEEYSMRYMFRRTGLFKHWPRFRRALAECNRLVYAEIARRRASARRASDLLDALLHADGEPLTDQQVRDQLITIIVAGHETSATAVCWAFERLIRHPSAHAVATAEALEGSGSTYAEAVMNETMRLRPAIAFYGRVTRKTFRLGAYDIPPKTLLMPHLRGIHRNAVLYPQPDTFRPERFLDKRPGAYEFVPFGAGVHRCLGDRLAMFQTTLFLQTFLRELVLAPVDPRSEPMSRKTIVYTPGRGATVTAQRRAS